MKTAKSTEPLLLPMKTAKSTEPLLLPMKTAKSAEPLLPPELVDEIISFVPPVVQEARYKTVIAGPKGIDVSLFGNYTVTFKGDVCVGGKADVHLSVTDERKDGRTKFPTYEFSWVTEVIGISSRGVDLARGDDESSYTINHKVVLGRLEMSCDDTCVPSGFFSSRSEMPKRGLKRCDSF
jgi:hypothetical protein